MKRMRKQILETALDWRTEALQFPGMPLSPWMPCSPFCPEVPFSPWSAQQYARLIWSDSDLQVNYFITNLESISSIASISSCRQWSGLELVNWLQPMNCLCRFMRYDRLISNIIKEKKTKHQPLQHYGRKRRRMLVSFVPVWARRGGGGRGEGGGGVGRGWGGGGGGEGDSK